MSHGKQTHRRDLPNNLLCTSFGVESVAGGDIQPFGRSLKTNKDPMKHHVLLLLLICLAILSAQAQQAETNPQPDARYKVDILIVVGHPDDDVEVAAYVARLIEEQHKTVSVVYGTRGNSGGNAAGPEQSKAADIREMEARRSLASCGIDNAWFMNGPDTPGGDVLHSLETWTIFRGDGPAVSHYASRSNPDMDAELRSR